MTLKELMSDESTRKQVVGRVDELVNGEKLDKAEAIQKAAAEFGCELSEDEITEIEKMENEEMSLDDLHNISGGDSDWTDYALAPVQILLGM